MLSGTWSPWFPRLGGSSITSISKAQEELCVERPWTNAKEEAIKGVPL